jgi:hypothetical protein
LENVVSGVNYQLMMARREIYEYPMGGLAIVKSLRVGVIVEMFYGGRPSGEKMLGLCVVIEG